VINIILYTHNRLMAFCPGLPGVGRYQKASSSFSLRAWQSFSITSVRVLFGLHIDLGPCTSYSVHFFTQSSSSFHSTCPYHRSLFCCSANLMSSIPNHSSNNAHNSTMSSSVHANSTPYLDYVFYLNVTHPSDHSHFCWLKCHQISYCIIVNITTGIRGSTSSYIIV